MVEDIDFHALIAIAAPTLLSEPSENYLGRTTARNPRKPNCKIWEVALKIEVVDLVATGKLQALALAGAKCVAGLEDAPTHHFALGGLAAKRARWAK
jgi:hypothetical protein